ncbi:MAG: biotin--[acetyl-CoA-carboxylase] ligase, partial [Chitinophagaceae bacterium]
DPNPLMIGQQFRLSVAVALACYDFFSRYAGDETAIKWPNDIYWRDRKAAGILLENVIRGVDWKWCIAGIGINVNQTSFAIDGKNPVSLKQITGKQFDIVLMAKELCEKLEARYQELRNGKQEALLLAYNNVLYKKNQPVKLKKGNANFYCTIDKVAINGCLEVKNAAQDSFDFGEIEWVL